MEFKNQKLYDFEKNLKGLKVAVIGLGVSNIPLIDYLKEKQANVTVFDDREEEKIDTKVINKLKQYGYYKMTTEEGQLMQVIKSDYIE